MTKKDYELIAQAIADTWCDAAAQLAIAESIAKALADTNPTFNIDRFLAMCGVVDQTNEFVNRPIDDYNAEINSDSYIAYLNNN
jgi:hypothetical protein